MERVALLPFQYEILTELNAEDGLCILASGLCWTKVIVAFLRAHRAASYGGTILLLGFKPFQKEALEFELHQQDPSSKPPCDIHSTMTSSDRLVFYTSGDCCYATPRVLVVDLLMDRMPPETFAGIFVMNAEHVTENSGIEFVVRLFRTKNAKGFVRGISDQPVSFYSGFDHVRMHLSVLVKEWIRLKGS